MLTEFAAIAEIIASLGVILSLLFVGYQMRQSNQASRMQAIQAIWEFEMELSSNLIEHADVWNKAVTGQPIEDDVERRKAIIMFNMLMSESENRFYQFREGYLKESEWHSRLTSLELLLNLPVYHIWKEAVSARNHSADFLNLLDDISKQQ